MHLETDDQVLTAIAEAINNHTAATTSRSNILLLSKNSCAAGVNSPLGRALGKASETKLSKSCYDNRLVAEQSVSQ